MTHKLYQQTDVSRSIQLLTILVFIGALARAGRSHCLRPHQLRHSHCHCNRSLGNHCICVKRHPWIHLLIEEILPRYKPGTNHPSSNATSLGPSQRFQWPRDAPVNPTVSHRQQSRGSCWSCPM
ncbi:hypothetical protein M431DRAFT_200757 [Trichoderma harzianum CBS 226.95]|uniref:Uncharacterized protein n=1 Tax=Trichoderma harzianum CBS 226.95 TaxID=983964 RepID=A0A2T4AV60_TRIHA|nr:hypothetical protein M431DRAFT_200757 [Trichoderma harzianum CBS 226.95]PTB60952.1 hypothetical protein M431DRAFT_200757 [Trichoderma harzianum CBS 226.95]